MHVITHKRLLDFAREHPNSQSGLEHWYRVVKRHNFDTFVELRGAFPHADQVGKLTVFNIGGNKFRLIAAIHYNRHRVYIRQVLTHAEYNKGQWKEITRC
ncbi:type II toxin-antitoxin system HigB family toxin [Chloroflexota bacterium]